MASGAVRKPRGVEPGRLNLCGSGAGPCGGRYVAHREAIIIGLRLLHSCMQPFWLDPVPAADTAQPAADMKRFMVQEILMYFVSAFTSVFTAVPSRHRPGAVSRAPGLGTGALPLGCVGRPLWRSRIVVLAHGSWHVMSSGQGSRRCNHY